VDEKGFGIGIPTRVGGRRVERKAGAGKEGYGGERRRRESWRERRGRPERRRRESWREKREEPK
jgi:hypothetical protein